MTHCIMGRGQARALIPLRHVVVWCRRCVGRVAGGETLLGHHTFHSVLCLCWPTWPLVAAPLPPRSSACCRLASSSSLCVRARWLDREASHRVVGRRPPRARGRAPTANHYSQDSGTIVYNKVPGPRPLHILIQLLPGRTVFGWRSLKYQGSAINKPFGQAAAGSECGAAAVHGSHCLQPCSGWLALHGCWLAACMQFCKTEI